MKIDVSKYKAIKKLSIEEAARELRYQFLSRVAIKAKTNIIAIGHTSDDQVETILMNIIRGCGLNGLKGMNHLTTRKINSRTFSLFRPLLNIERVETLNYCKNNHFWNLDPRREAPMSNRIANQSLIRKSWDFMKFMEFREIP